ncbi:MAG: Putative PROLIN-rich signal peptide protein [Burkholderiaceae bacterium]|jgi:hypothetical protein|nr:MAG: Putative PROLIN-rich signal peptide protein [Burkholderiaceae bacterium]
MHRNHADAGTLRSPRRGAPMRRRLIGWIALTAAVLLAHLALLQARPPQVAPRATPAPQAFNVRTVYDESIPASAPPAALETTVLEPAGRATGLSPEATRSDTRRAAGATPARAMKAASRSAARSERNRSEALVVSAQLATNPIAIRTDDAARAPSARRAPATAPGAPEAPDPIVAAAQIPESPAQPAAPTHAAAQAVQPTAFRIAAPVRLDYEVQGEIRGIAYQAQAELLWRHDADRYDAQLAIEVPLIGTRRQTSTGRLGTQGLEPIRFSDKARSELAAHFVRPQSGGAGHVVFSANTPQLPLEPGAQDRLSVFLQLGAMLAAAPERYPRGSTIALQIVGPRDADLWRFEVGASERLALPYGEVDATQLDHAPQRDYDTRVDLWLAPRLDWLPVRILLTRPRGERLDLRLRALGSPD